MSTTLNRFAGKLGVRTVGAIYVWLLIILVFSIWSPDTFFTMQTLRTILNQNAVTGLVALGLVMPLSAGIFDLSIGATIALSGVVAAWVIENSSLNPLLSALIGVAAACAVGVFNSVVVVGLRVDSFIATLASGSIVSAITIAVSGNQLMLTGTSGPFSNIAQGKFLSVTLPVFYMLGVMVILGVVLQKTVLGRQIYATGFDSDTAKLAGIHTRSLKALSMLVSAGLAGVAGIVLASTLGAGSTTQGPTYLLPGFAAAFLGATQFQPGRFNTWGTIVAVLMIGTGQTGIILVGAPSWAPDVFLGLVLIIAVSITGVERRGNRRQRGARAGEPARVE